MTTNYKYLLTHLFDTIERMRKEQPSAGTRYRLMGLAADVLEVVESLQQVLACVSKEAVLDADADLNFAELAEQVLATELEEQAGSDDGIREQVRLVNGALGELNRGYVIQNTEYSFKKSLAT
jgi:hypothetical protein